MNPPDFGLFVAILLLSLISVVISQKELIIDREADIPNDGTWEVECPNGYEELSTDYICEFYGEGINIPPDQLNGERGFWTKCDYRCLIRYTVQPGDVSFKARIYQSNLPTEVSFDGTTWDYIDGEGWVYIHQELKDGDKQTISLRFDHFSPDYFNILDKIAINVELPDPPTSTTESESSTSGMTDGDSSTTTETTSDDTSATPTDGSIGSTTDDGSISSTTSDSSESTLSTTDDSAGTVSDDPTNPSSEYPSTSEVPSSENTFPSSDNPSTQFTNDPSTGTDTSETSQTWSTTEITGTTNDDITSTTSDVSGSTTTGDDISSTSDSTEFTYSTTDDSSGTVSYNPTYPSSSDFPTSENPFSSSTSDPSSDQTIDPSTTNPSSTGDDSTLTTKSTSDGTTDSGPVISTPTSVAPPVTPIDPCLKPPWPCTPSRRTTTTEKPSGAGFITGVWGALMFGLLGLALLLLLLVFCLRCVCVRWDASILRRRRSKEDMEDIISQSDSGIINHGQMDRELYLYMERYPHVSKSLPPPLTSSKFVPLASPPPPPPPPAIYRDNTPYPGLDHNDLRGRNNNGTSAEAIYALPAATRQLSPSANTGNTNHAISNNANNVQVLPRYPINRHGQEPQLIPQRNPENFHPTNYREIPNNQHRRNNNRTTWVVP